MRCGYRYANGYVSRYPPYTECDALQTNGKRTLGPAPTAGPNVYIFPTYSVTFPSRVVVILGLLRYVGKRRFGPLARIPTKVPGPGEFLLLGFLRVVSVTVANAALVLFLDFGNLVLIGRDCTIAVVNVRVLEPNGTGASLVTVDQVSNPGDHTKGPTDTLRNGRRLFNALVRERLTEILSQGVDLRLPNEVPVG